MTPTDPNVTITFTQTVNPFRTLLAVAAGIADALTAPTSFHIDMIATNTPNIRIYVHQNDAAATALAARLGFSQQDTSVTRDSAHLNWAVTLAGIPVKMTTLVDLEDWLRRTVDDFDQLPEQGPFYSPPPLARQFARTFTCHELRLDQLLTEAAAAEDVQPRDEKLITARYAAARRYAKAAGLTFGGCICGRDAEHAPTPACVWKARPTDNHTGPQAIADMPAEHTHYRATYPAASGEVVQQGHTDACATYGHAVHKVDGVEQAHCPRCGEASMVDLGTPGAPHHKVLRDGDQVTGHHTVSEPLPGC